MWADQKQPFENVRKVSIGRTIEETEDEMTGFEKLFPNVLKLNLESVDSFDDAEQAFLLLEDLTINFAPYNRSHLNASDIGKILQKNTQIRSLVSNNVELIDYLDGLKQLETISLDGKSDVNEETLIKVINNNENLASDHFKAYGCDIFWKLKQHFYGSRWNITPTYNEVYWDQPETNVAYLITMCR